MSSRVDWSLLARLTAETGIGCTHFGKFHEFAEKTLGRPIFTHEFAEESTWLALKVALVMPEYREVVREDPVTMLERRVGKDRVIRVG